MSQDYVALEWVKGELEDTLTQAQQSLEAYVDNPQDQVRLNFCINYLHQVYGTLKIVEFYGAALLAEEMEDVAVALRDKKTANELEALEILMRAIIQLPSYLEHIKIGRRDLPIILLPILNELRSTRGESLLSETGLFNPEIKPVAAISAEQLEKYSGDEFIAWVKKLRQMLQSSMLHLLKDQQLVLAYDYLEKVFARLHKTVGKTPHGAVWLPALGFTAALRHEEKLSSPAKKLIKQLDVQLKELQDQGNAVLNNDMNVSLIKNLLFYVAQSEKQSGLVATVKKHYGLLSMATADQAEDVFSRPDKATVGTVVTVLIEEISEIKDQFDLLVRSQDDRSAGIISIIPALDKIANTMKLLSLGMPLKVFQEQIASLHNLAQQPDIQADDLMDVAGALLYVEATLTGMQIDGTFDVVRPEETSISDAQMAVLREARNVIEQVKDSVVEFISKQWATEEIDDVPHWLKTIEGSLAMIPMPRVSTIIASLSSYVQLRLINAGEKPQWQELDQFADILTGIEYYLERYINNSADAEDSLLERAEKTLAQLLGHHQEQSLVAQEQDELAGIELDDADAESTIVASVALEDESPVEVEIETRQPSQAITPIDLANLGSAEVDETLTLDNLLADVQEVVDLHPSDQDIYSQMASDMQAPEESASDEQEQAPEPELPVVKSTVETTVEDTTAEDDDDDLIDDEIIEIFLEEAEEVLEAIDESWPAYKNNHEDSDAQTIVRRAFHTLKGSGRMVQAETVGELSWSIENYINRVIDKTVELNHNGIELIDHVIEVLPKLVEDFKLRRSASVEIQPLIDYAAMVANGEAVENFVDRFAQQETAEAVVEDLAPAVEETLATESDSDEIILDEMLLEIFETETTGHIACVQNFIEESRDCQYANVISDPLQRSLHTLKGSAHMAGITPIAVIAAPLEKLVKELRSYQAKNTPGLVSMLEDGILMISQGLDQLRTTPRADIVGSQEYLEQLAQLEDLLLAPVSGSPGGAGPDPQQLSQLLMNGMDALLEADSSVSDWSQSPKNTDVLKTLITELDELQQGAIGADIVQLSLLAEELKKLYKEIILDPPVSVADEFVELAHEAHEALLAMLDNLAAGQDVLSPAEIIEKLNNWQFESADDIKDDIAVLETINVEEANIDEQLSADDNDELPLPVIEEVDPVDDELMSIFIEEAVEITESSVLLLGSWQQAPEKLVNVAELQRELHTLKGGARMAEVPAIANLCHELENIYELVNVNRVLVDSELFTQLHAAHDGLDDLLEQLKQGLPLVNPDQLIKQIKALVKRQLNNEIDLSDDDSESQETNNADVANVEGDVALDVANIDFDPETFEIIEIFMEEAQELLTELDSNLHAWQGEPQNQTHSAEIQRIMHTLKGGARLANLTLIGDLCHDFESWLIKLQLDGEASDEAFFAESYRRQDQLSQRIEAVAEFVQQHITGQNSPEASATAILDTEQGSPAEIAVVPSDDSNVVPFKRDAEQQLVAVEEPEAQVPEAKAKAKPAAAVSAKKAPHEMVKVSADLLDGLVNLAGETSISRGRLEQQVNDFSYTLTDMDTTLDRLRDQLRRLDMETEAQVLFRQERQGPSYDDFDPLEMDRYSQMQQLARSLMESASDLLDLKDTLTDKARDAETLLLQQSRVNTELQEGLMQTRMVPFQRLVPRLRRIVRQVSQELGKTVEFHVYNADGEMDRSILERLITPLEHMLRNAVDHGLETEEQRFASGKEAQGNVELHISREGSDVMVRLKDDGRGFNIDAIRAKAIERGLIQQDTELNNHDVLQLILTAGFSTAASVTQISGRGVGMDVVNSEIKQMGGALSVQTETGVGTEFTIRLPFTVSVNRALMVKVGDDLYAVPLDSIRGIVRIPVPQLNAIYEKPKEQQVYSYDGQDYPLNYLGELLNNESHPKLVHQPLPIPVLLVQGDVPYALQVDTLLGSREIVVKTLGSQFSSVVGVSGGTILGDGSVVIILDLPSMMRRQASLEYQQAIAIEAQKQEQRQIKDQRRKRVLVVDDSVTVRKVSGRLLERNGYEVFTAKDGVDAIELLQDHIPDVMLLDIEMPRMDGFEVASIVRHDERLKDVPIIMITSRTGEKHKNRALSIGVNRYLGKPFQEDILLSTMANLLAEVEA